MSAFPGFSDDALEFYDGLGADNSKAYWQAHRETYERAVRAPMVALLDALEPEFGAGKVYRPYRDVRYARDKTPYKTHQGGFVPRAPGVGLYVEVSADGLRTAGGWWSSSGQQVARFREAVAGPGGAELARLVEQLTSAGQSVDGDRLKTRPRGYDPDHPRLELLRHRTLGASRMHGAPDWLGQPEALDRVREEWRAVEPLVGWLAATVGPADDGRS
jgi:uncharacterized protein (TIGR02453 family)